MWKKDTRWYLVCQADAPLFSDPGLGEGLLQGREDLAVALVGTALIPQAEYGDLAAGGSLAVSKAAG